MEKEKNTAIEENDVKEIAEKVTETAEEMTETAEEMTEAAEEMTEAAEEVTEAAEVAEQGEPAAEEAPAPVKISSKRIKKIERREAKAARKAANKIEEKKSRPNNALIAILIFGVVIAMFVFVLGYNYFSKPATVEKYIEKNGGAETYGNFMLDNYTTANITADGNSMNIKVVVDDSEELVAEQAKEFYKGETGEETLKQIAAYFITSIKPNTRAFSADVKATLSVGDEELQSVEMTYKEAKDFLEELENKSDEDADADTGEDTDADGNTEEAAEDSAEGE